MPVAVLISEVPEIEERFRGIARIADDLPDFPGCIDSDLHGILVLVDGNEQVTCPLEFPVSLVYGLLAEKCLLVDGVLDD